VDSHFFSPARARRLTVIAVALTVAAVPATAQDPPPQPDFELRLGTPGEGQACFFERTGYEGGEFCASAGEVALFLTGDWAREISSIKVGPGTVVELCIDFNLENCTSFSADTPELPEDLDDNSRSLRVSVPQ
jgi:hypothetical protein